VGVGVGVGVGRVRVWEMACESGGMGGVPKHGTPTFALAHLHALCFAWYG